MIVIINNKQQFSDRSCREFYESQEIEWAKPKWVDALSVVLWALKTTLTKGTNHSPLTLTHGLEAILLVEYEIPSEKVLILKTSQDKTNKWTEANSEVIKNKLDMLEELRLEVSQRQETTKR